MERKPVMIKWSRLNVLTERIGYVTKIASAFRVVCRTEFSNSERYRFDKRDCPIAGQPLYYFAGYPGLLKFHIGLDLEYDRIHGIIVLT